MQDPTTLVILSPAAVAGPLDFRSMVYSPIGTATARRDEQMIVHSGQVQWHVSCTRKAKPSRELCRREDGSISFRRLGSGAIGICGFCHIAAFWSCAVLEGWLHIPPIVFKAA